MSRLTDADNLIRYVADTYGSGPCDDVRIWYRDVLTLIQAAPTIDPVRYAGGCYCRECKYKTDHGTCSHPRHEILPTAYPNDFCSYGKNGVQDDE